MSRRFAHRPRYQPPHIHPQSSRHSRQEYLRQRWTYRQQRIFFPKRSPGSGLVNLPWGWRPVRALFQRRA